ncbi:MAG TPA: phosphoribosylglycinamide formyltransferase [Leucothrix mucor]|nr:phosphoribosylglycinamide formyltransferase [Leucothrix mucor]
MSNPKNIIILISGNGSNLQAIIDQIELGKINANIAAVISNKKNARGLQRATLANIPTHIVDHTHYSTRDDFDQALVKIIDGYSVDIIVLAGFMRILTPNFVTRYQGKLINIHPSLLPLHRGLHTHRRALEDSVTQHGASVHFVTPELDAGAVLIQGVVPVRKNDTETSLAERVHIIEHLIYPAAVKLLVDNTIKLKDNNIFINGSCLIKAKQYCLDDDNFSLKTTITKDLK